MTPSRVVRRAAVLTVLAAAPVALLASSAHAQNAVARPGAATAPSQARSADLLAPVADGQATGVQRRLTAAQRAAGTPATGPALDVVLAQAAAPTCAITGIVWDDANHDGLKTQGEGPIDGSTVVLRWNSTTVLASQTTGADGRYRFDDLQCGAYDVGFTLPSGYSWTRSLVAGGAQDSKATDPGASFLDGVTPAFTVGPGESGTRRSTAADAVQASYVAADVDAGMFRTGSAAAAQAAPTTTQAPTQAPGAAAAAAAQTATPAQQQSAAAGGLASTGTAAETIGWTGAGLLAAGVVMVAATSSRGPRHARQRA